jgi:hypothetical protein
MICNGLRPLLISAHLGKASKSELKAIYISLIYTRKGYFTCAYAFSMVALADSQTN